MGLSLFFRVFIIDLFTACFITNLFQWVIMLSTVSFFVSFHIGNSNGKFDLIESSNQILLVSMLQILNFMYSKYIWIIKCVGLELIIFAINLNTASSFKVLHTFDSMLLLINKFITFKK